MDANRLSETPAISADGRYVAFSSDASDLVPGDTNHSDDVFVRDLKLSPPPSNKFTVSRIGPRRMARSRLGPGAGPGERGRAQTAGMTTASAAVLLNPPRTGSCSPAHTHTRSGAAL